MGTNMECSQCGGLVTWRGPLIALTHTQCESCGGVNCQVVDMVADQSFDYLEQAAFEKWLSDTCPSGDVESVQRQWLESSAYADLLDEQDPEWQNAVQAAFGGIVQTPQG